MASKRFRIEFTVDMDCWDANDIEAFAIQELTSMSPYPKDIEFSEVGWHTETPTEDGQYFVAYKWGLDNQIMHDMAKKICYGATVFSQGTWNIEFPFVVLAWQRIEPYKEAGE